jgi:hypothetical protein
MGSDVLLGCFMRRVDETVADYSNGRLVYLSFWVDS